MDSNVDSSLVHKALLFTTQLIGSLTTLKVEPHLMMSLFVFFYVIEKTKANLNGKNTQERRRRGNGELCLKKYFSKTTNSSKGSTKIKR